MSCSEQSELKNPGFIVPVCWEVEEMKWNLAGDTDEQSDKETGE